MDIVRAFESGEDVFHVKIRGAADNPLFLVNDIGRVLNLTNIRQNVGGLHEEWCFKLPTTTDTVTRHMLWVNTFGLYELIFRSEVPVARKFRVWVYHVIEEIRTTGTYQSCLSEEQLQEHRRLRETAEADAARLRAQTEAQAEVIRTQNKQLEARKKQNSVVYVLAGGPGEFKIGRTSDKDARIKTYNTGRPDKTYYEWYDFHPQAYAVEQMVFAALSAFSKDPDSRREWFNVSLETAIRVIQACMAAMDELKVDAEVDGGLRAPVEQQILPPKWTSLEEFLTAETEQGEHVEGALVPPARKFKVGTRLLYEHFLNRMQPAKQCSKNEFDSSLISKGFRKKTLARDRSNETMFWLGIRLQNSVPAFTEAQQFARQFVDSPACELGKDLYTPRKGFWPAFLTWAEVELHMTQEQLKQVDVTKKSLNQALSQHIYLEDGERDDEPAWLGVKLAGPNATEKLVDSFFTDRLRHTDAMAKCSISKTDMWRIFCDYAQKRACTRNNFTAQLQKHVRLGYPSGVKFEHWLNVVPVLVQLR